MIKVGYYSIADIRAILIPCIIGGTYDTLIHHKNEYFKLRIIVVGLKDGLVKCKRIYLETNMNGNQRIENFSRQIGILKIPQQIFTEHFKHVL